MFKKPNTEIVIDNKRIGENNPTYFIADIAANHDGDLTRACDLIFRAADAGSDAIKFQHFEAKTIVSEQGFMALGGQASHQSSWKKSVFEVYSDASVRLEWTETLKAACKSVNLPFFTTPYALDIVDYLDPHVPAYKIGSGDITWIEMIEKVAAKGKPYILASGASTADEVDRAVAVGLSLNPNIVLMQCNTNYTASLENFKYIQLNVLKTYRSMYPDMVLGLSDHTPGHTTVLGAIALGARMIEKHFTDDVSRDGPDHKFSMDPMSWKQMILGARELELALGMGVKKVEENEKETVVLQRRALRASTNLKKGQILGPTHLIPLRPCPPDAIQPFDIKKILGKALRKDINCGDFFKFDDFE